MATDFLPGTRRYPFVPTRSGSWMLIIWGILAVAFGIVAVVWPGITLLNLAVIFGAFAVITGVVELAHTFTANRPAQGRLLLGLRGLAAVVLGLLAVVLPGLAVAAYVLLIGAYFFIAGLIEIAAAFHGHVHGWLLLRGIIAVLAGLVAVFWPGIAALTLAVIFGIYAILAGLTALCVGISLLRHHDQGRTAGWFDHARAG